MATVIQAKIVSGTNQETADDLAQLKSDATSNTSAVAADLQKLTADWKTSGFDSKLMVGRVDAYLKGGSNPLDTAKIGTVDDAMTAAGSTGTDSDFASWLSAQGLTMAQANEGVDDVSYASDGSSVGESSQSGTGWVGDVNVASTSATYQGLSLDQLMASNSGIGQALKQHPDIVAAIQKVSSETGAPAGLLAGVIYQESGFDVNSSSGNPDPTSEDSSDLGLCQCPNSDFTGDSWKDPYTNIMDFASKYLVPTYKQTGSWGEALRDWNTGSTSNTNDLSQESNNTDSNYVTEILAKHCMGLD